MTVAELIEVLGALPPSLRVVVDAYEVGFNDVDAVESLTVQPNQQWGGEDGGDVYGAYERPERSTLGKGTAERVVWIRGPERDL